jgi:hypothetical protein
MTGQNGSAVAMVLLFLGVVSIIGAGLMLQSKMDVQFTSAIQGADLTLNVGDAASGKAFRNLPDKPPMAETYKQPIVADSGPKSSDLPSSYTVQGGGTFSWRTVSMGPAPAMTGGGYEMGQGGYSEGFFAWYWTAEGNGRTSSMLDSETRVQTAARKMHPKN